MTPQDILDFWFTEAGPEKWYKKDEVFDAELRARFLEIHTQIVQGTDGWDDSLTANFARVIVLDQFSRNMFRDTPEAFLHDTQALAIAQAVVDDGEDEKIPVEQRAFLYMPYMHSESRAVHEEAVTLFEKLGNAENVKYEYLHKDIIDRFGRYPHRNAILGRETTPEEQAFLDSDEVSSF